MVTARDLPADKRQGFLAGGLDKGVAQSFRNNLAHRIQSVAQGVDHRAGNAARIQIINPQRRQQPAQIVARHAPSSTVRVPRVYRVEALPGRSAAGAVKA